MNAVNPARAPKSELSAAVSRSEALRSRIQGELLCVAVGICLRAGAAPMTISFPT
jgi:hypothetical protein